MDTTSTGHSTEPPAVVQVFGGMGVTLGGEPISIGGIRQQRLLALLAVRAGQVVSVDWLAEHLWTDEERPGDPIPSLRTYISRLRGALPEDVRDWIATAPAGYQLTAPAEAVEHRRFLLLRSEAARATREHDFANALQLLDDALRLWTGDPFRELEDVAATRAEVEQLHIDRLEMFEERWQAALALGRHTQITGELAAFTAAHGLRDRAVRQHALALHRSGRTADALAALAEHRDLLAEETGLDPSPAALELERRLFAGDPALDGPDGDGRSLRGYRLLAESGRGAFSVVWRGVQPSVDREVAIKQIHAELAAQPDFIRRFEAEAHLVARIEHPYIVPLIDFWRDPESAYLVMRWMRGGTLERRLDDGPLTVEKTLRVANQIGRALAAAHRKGVVHRDVKTANILFDEHDNALLGDFGIAMVTGGAGAGGAAAELSLGTPAYAAPEQIRREQLGPQADVFSLGVVLFECLTGTAPFGDLPGPETVERQLHEPYPLVTELRDDVPEQIAAAIARATAKDVVERFSTVLDFVDAMDATTKPGAVPAAAPADIPNPYVGLRAFDEGDAERYFGRARLVDELAGRLGGHGPSSRCLFVVGPSGSGKSSAVRAGLIPAVRAGALPGSDTWFTTTMLPGADPFAALEEALLRVAIDPSKSLGQQLRSGRRGILKGVRDCVQHDDDVVLLVIDQLEEVFTSPPEEVTDAFLRALTRAVEDPQTPLRVVATIRADHFHLPLGHPAVADLVKQATVHVTPLVGDELERAVTEPALAAGVRFEAGLVARITAEAAGRTGSLPLLQYALTELFEQRDGALLSSAAYAEIGGLTGALAARAEALFASSAPAEQAATRRLFGRLTDPSTDGTDLRRRARRADLGTDEATMEVLERYGRVRLLTFDHEASTREPTVEVAHEALLREWPRLVAWLREDRDVLRTATTIAVAADVWDAADRQPSDLLRGPRLATAVELADAAPERLRPVDRDFVAASRRAADAARAQEARRVRRLRRLVAGTAAALVLALVAGGVAVVQQRRAADEAARAQLAADEALAAAAAADLATLISRSAALVGEEDDVAVLLALEAHRRAAGPETEGAVLNALARTSVGGRISSLPLAVPSGDECPGFQFSPWLSNRVGPLDRTLTSVVDGELIRLELATGERTTFGTGPAPCVVWGADATDDRWWAWDPPTRRFWHGAFGQEWGEPITLPPATFPIGSPLLDGSRLVLVENIDRGSFYVADLGTGVPIGDFPPVGRPGPVEVAADGTLLAAGYSRPGDPDGAGVLTVMDATTGAERWRLTTPQPPTAVDIDEGADQVLAAFPDAVLTLDLGTGDVLHEIDPGVTGIDDLGALDDDRVLVTNFTGIFELDRTTGPTGRELPVDDANAPFVDDEGLIHVRTPTRVDTYDLGVPALAITTYDVPPGTVVLGAEHAVATAQTSPDVTVVDLGTGVQTNQELRLPDGSSQSLIGAARQDDGSLVTWSDAPVRLTRWVDGRPTSRVELHPDPYVEWHGTQPADGRWVSHVLREDGSVEIVVVALEGGDLAFRQRVVVAEDILDLVLPDLTLVTVAVQDGTLRVHDPPGQLVQEFETGIGNVTVGAIDPDTGRLALGTLAGEHGVVVIDIATGEQQPLSVATAPLSAAWVGTDALALGTADGALQLWDVVEDRPIGQLYRGSGSIRTAPLVDPAARTIWVAAVGALLEFPLDPATWIARACEVVARDLTQDEWDRWVPGGGTAVSACGTPD